jgi:transcription antitermination factor NusG
MEFEMSWVILRTSGRTTMRLAETLSGASIEAWTPIETRTIRVPRKNVKRVIKLPIMPSYVFARAESLFDLIELAGNSLGAHPSFSVMHYHDRIPVIADHHLVGLRTIEAKKSPRKRADPLPKGLSVRVKTEGGSFAGMKGRVERSDKNATLVCFDSRLVVKISTSLLLPDEIGMERPCLGLAA